MSVNFRILFESFWLSQTTSSFDYKDFLFTPVFRVRELLKASYYDKWNYYYINGKTYWVLTTSLVLQSRTGANQVPPKQNTNHVPLKQSTGTSNDLTRQNFMIPNNKTNALAIMNFIEVFNVQWIYISVSRRYLEFNNKNPVGYSLKICHPKGTGWSSNHHFSVAFAVKAFGV